MSDENRHDLDVRMYTCICMDVYTYVCIYIYACTYVAVTSHGRSSLKHSQVDGTTATIYVHVFICL